MRAPISTGRKKIYVNSKLCYYLYYVCDFLFENIDEFDFIDLMNMRPLHHETKKYGKKECKIKICSKQEDKFCYLLYMISEALQFPIEEREKWLVFICEATGLSRSYYRSYHLRVLKTDKNDDKDFVSMVEQAFKNSKLS